MPTGSSRRSKRRADDDHPARPAPSLRQADGPAADQQESDLSSTQALLNISTSTVAGEAGIASSDPEVESQLLGALQSVLREKRNLFITGPAGSGKSFLTRGLVRELRLRKIDVRLIAPTGTAAMNVNGRTCHSFFGLTPNLTKRGIASVMMAAKNPRIEARLRKLQVLIIDEVSMVSSNFFEQMSRLLQEVQHTKSLAEKSFGGIKVVVIGDFAQLGPVKPFENCFECGQMLIGRPKTREYVCPIHGPFDETTKWAFCADAWQKAKFKVICLGKILRQKDEAFADIVWNCWLGNALTELQMSQLRQLKVLAPPALRLYSRRKDVDKYNAKEYSKLTGWPRSYICHDAFELHPRHVDRPWIKKMAKRVPPHNSLLSQQGHRFQENLLLKVGMPVILLHNMCVEKGLVNGSVGMVIEFQPYDPTVIRGSDGSIEHTGYSFDDESGLNPHSHIAALGGSSADCVFQGRRKFWMENAATEIPIVEFTNGIREPIFPQCSVDELVHDDAVSRTARTQIPLIAGWASTIHRAQGMSLDRVIVDLSSSFEPGQQYVAISRARSLAGLLVRNLEADTMQSHPQEVREFMKKHLSPAITEQMQD